jgi:hypothetical protein
MVMVVMDAAQCQSWKAQPPMLVTEMGISTLRREVQPPEEVSFHMWFARKMGTRN